MPPENTTEQNNNKKVSNANATEANKAKLEGKSRPKKSAKSLKQTRWNPVNHEITWFAELRNCLPYRGMSCVYLAWQNVSSA